MSLHQSLRHPAKMKLFQNLLLRKHSVEVELSKLLQKLGFSQALIAAQVKFIVDKFFLRPSQPGMRLEITERFL